MSSVSTFSPRSGIDIKAALIAGFIAGVVDQALLVAGLVLEGAGFWSSTRLTASLLMGRDVLQPATFDPIIVAVATVVHFGLSFIYALAIAFVVRNANWTTGVMIGVAAGFVIYIFNFYFAAPLFFPWWIEQRGLVATLIHPVFGLIAAAAYMWLRNKKPSQR